ncbi:hypothetical protein VaNZ11_007197 [Volvox africanus]|uniref:ABC transporter domain-containing protein n=1 Tax=Volvox africanus TaxID=51714 RepID=A0ABQ5S306_9CHLO|nr:hypothetical protein VaNZ11_007197 [Volvox africanus]
MYRSLYFALLLLQAKFRGIKFLAAEILSPSLIMVVTFVLGWAISTTDRYKVLIFADGSHHFIHAQADILRRAGWNAGIPTCLSPLARATESELVQRQRDREAARRHELWQQEHFSRNRSSIRQGNDGLVTATDDSQQRPQWQLLKGFGGTEWIFASGNRGSLGELVGREVVMALLSATKKPGVSEALEGCNWQEMWASALPLTINNIFNQMLSPTALLTFDEWLLMGSFINATLEASGKKNTLEATLELLMPVMPVSGMQPGWLALVPDTPQVRAFAAHMSATTRFFDDVFLGTYDSVAAAMDAVAVAKTSPAPRAADGASAGEINSNASGEAGGKGRPRRRPLVTPGRLWAVIEFVSGPEPGRGVDYAIRMNAMHVPRTFSKLSPLDCKTCSNDFLPYVASGFLSLQAAVSGYVVDLGGRGQGSLNASAGARAVGRSPLSEETAWLHKPAFEATGDGDGSSRQRDGSEAQLGVSSNPYGIWFTPLPNVGQEINAFYEYGSPLLGFLTTCSFALPLAMVVRHMTSQRQSGLQHLLEVVGLSRCEWLLAWLLAGLLPLAASFAAEGMLAQSTYLELVQPGLLAAVVGAAALAAAGWAVLLGCCFRDAKVAATGCFAFTLAVGLPFLALYTTAPMQLIAVKRTCCLMWPFALSVILQRMAAGHQLRRYGDSRSVSDVPGLNWSTMTHGPLSSAELLGFLLLDAVLYLAAAAAVLTWRGLSVGQGAGSTWGFGKQRRGCSGIESGHEARGSGDDRTAVLKLNGVTHRYPGNEHRALDDVSLSIGAGEAVALLGRNAAGKSSLMAVSCGRMKPNGGGVVRVAGCIMYGRNGVDDVPYRHLGYCPQGNVLMPDLTAFEHLQLALVLRGATEVGWVLPGRAGGRELRAAALKLATLVSLPQDMLQLLVSQLSGGSLRKLQLAIAMAGEPPLLLLDEVTAGVDVESSQAMWEALVAAKQGPWGSSAREGGNGSGTDCPAVADMERAPHEHLHRPTGRGAALLFTSHHLSEVSKLADWVAVMQQGQLLSLTPAAALHSLLQEGDQRVLRITTRPARQQQQQQVIAVALASSSIPPAIPYRSFTRSQLLELILRRLGPSTTRVLYSHLTFSAVYVEIAATAMGAVGASKVKFNNGSISTAPSLESLEQLLQELRPQVGGAAGTGPITTTPIDTFDRVQVNCGLPGGGSASSSRGSQGMDSEWGTTPLMVVRCGLGRPTLEDVLLLGLGPRGASAQDKGQSPHMSLQNTARLGIGEPHDGAIRGKTTDSPAASIIKFPVASKKSVGNIADTTTTANLQSINVGSFHAASPQELRPGGFPLPGSNAAEAVDVVVDACYCADGRSDVLTELMASLPPLLTKQRLTWLRDHVSSARMLLLPVVVVGLAILALSIHPLSTEISAPLNLAWLGQDQPTPVAGLPPAWRHTAHTTTPVATFNGDGNIVGNVSVPRAMTAAVNTSEAGLVGLGLLPLQAEWMSAAGAGKDPDKFPSSSDVSVWFAKRAQATSAATTYGPLGALEKEPSAPLQSALVFGDVVTARLNHTVWSAAGILMESLLAPANYEQFGLTDVPELRKAIQVLSTEEGALWKMLDFLYDRMLLLEVVSLVQYVMHHSGQRQVGTATATATSDSTRGTGGLDRSNVLNVDRMADLCQLELPGSEEEGKGKSAGGRTLLMRYRPPLEVSLYLLGSLLPPERRFCPLARLFVEQSPAVVKVIRRYVARRKLPALNLMWNISSPHGLPATLNHLHTTLLRLGQQTQHTHNTSKHTHRAHQQRHGSSGGNGVHAGSRGGGGGEERGTYADRVFKSTAIRVRSHPLPGRGATLLDRGLMGHLLLALMVAMPLSYTTGNFVVRAASEKASGAKHQQLAARRTSSLSYWLSFWLTDLALHALITAAIVGLMLLGGTEAFVGTSARCAGLAALLMAFAAAALPWGYCIGLRCANPASAQGLVSTAGLVVGVGLALARQILSHVPRWRWLADMLLPLLRLLPPFCLVDGLIQMSLFDAILVVSGLLGKHASRRGLLWSLFEGHLVGIDPCDHSPFQNAVLGSNLFYLVIDALLYGVVLLALERRMSHGSLFSGSPFPGWRLPRRALSAFKGIVAAIRALPAKVSSQYPGGIDDACGAGFDNACNTDATASIHLRQVKIVGKGASGGSGGGGGGWVSEPGTPLKQASCESTGGVSEEAGEFVVRVRDVYKEYGRGRDRLVALCGLSFQLRRGDCFGLIGRNGAGKSTAMAVLSGRLRPSGGSVVVGGLQVAGRLEAARGRVALCPQTNPLLPYLTPTEHLDMYSKLYGITSSVRGRRAGGAAATLPIEAAIMAARCGLPAELLHRPAGQLSGGSQRKLSLAISLLGRPQLLLLDEPSAGLDPPARRNMCDAINMAVRDWVGTSSEGSGHGAAPSSAPAVVLTTHYTEEAVALCDILGVLEAGRLVALGPPEQVSLQLCALRLGHYLEDFECEWDTVLTPLQGQ